MWHCSFLRRTMQRPSSNRNAPLPSQCIIKVNSSSQMSAKIISHEECIAVHVYLATLNATIHITLVLKWKPHFDFQFVRLAMIHQYYCSNTKQNNNHISTMSQSQSATMPHTKTSLTLIVAATPKNGIGKNGALPWPMLKKEMAYFARVTKRVPTSTSTSSNPSKAEDKQAKSLPRNAVIMGRKTWDSIPPKFRPLKDRTNIVISSQERGALSGVTDDVIVSSSILDGLSELEKAVQSGRAPALGRAYVIGGARIYNAAMELEQTKHVLLTRVAREYECDTFFPDLEGSEQWARKERKELEDFVGEEVVEGGLEEEGVKYEFQLWERE